MGVVDRMVQSKPVPFVHISQNTNNIVTHENKIQMLFFFCFKSSDFFFLSTGRLGTRNKESNKREYIGGGNCEVHHVVLFILS